LQGPYGNIRFIPTGGISAANLKTYLDLPSVIACGGSWMVKADLINSGNFSEIQRLTAEAVASSEGRPPSNVT
jgi:2-dehydro-3-deoxyphosphogluconate aldolase/(4S)-4-hydroxy-2-oxoglutarate aldolase